MGALGLQETVIKARYAVSYKSAHFHLVMTHAHPICCVERPGELSPLSGAGWLPVEPAR